MDATGITTREVDTDADAIVPIHLAGRLDGSARISADLDYDLRASDVTLSMTGGLGPTDGRIFNRVLVDLEGIRITEAAVDTIHWAMEIEEGAARGRMLAIYRDLRMERLAKVTRTQSLGDQIASFLGNNFNLTPANPRREDEPPQSVVLSHRRSPTESFFKVLGVTLRGGVLESVGL